MNELKRRINHMTSIQEDQLRYTKYSVEALVKQIKKDTKVGLTKDKIAYILSLNIINYNINLISATGNNSFYFEITNILPREVLKDIDKLITITPYAKMFEEMMEDLKINLTANMYKNNIIFINEELIE